MAAIGLLELLVTRLGETEHLLVALAPSLVRGI